MEIAERILKAITGKILPFIVVLTISASAQAQGLDDDGDGVIHGDAVLFSTDHKAKGVAGSAVEAAGGTGQKPANIYGSFCDNTNLLHKTGTDLGILATPHSGTNANVSAIVQMPDGSFLFSVEKGAVGVSLSALAAASGTGLEAANIYRSTGDGTVAFPFSNELFASGDLLGIVAFTNSDVDALALMPDGISLIFSTDHKAKGAAGSAMAAAGSAFERATNIYITDLSGTNALFATGADLGITGGKSSNVDALDVQVGSTIVYFSTNNKSKGAPGSAVDNDKVMRASNIFISDLSVPGTNTLFKSGVCLGIAVPARKKDKPSNIDAFTLVHQADNCPDTANPDQADNEGDGQGDACDDDDDNDSILDEGDGIEGYIPCPDGETLACDDNCPKTFNPFQADSDDDGIGNECDNCWDVPNPSQANADGDDDGDVCDNDAQQDPPDWAGGPSSGSTGDEDNDGLADDDETEGGITSPSNPDSDGDGVCDGHIDDPDGTGTIIAGPDQCPGEDDTIDVDDDGTPDCNDPLIDSDDDGVADVDDVCAGFDDNLNFDGDALPDGCDPDDDNDGVADGADVCALGDDADDSDGDLIPDACDDTPFPGSNDIVFSSNPLSDWLPTDGGTVTFTGIVNDSLGEEIAEEYEITYSLISVTHHPGRYTNDNSETDVDGNEIDDNTALPIEDDFDLSLTPISMTIPFVGNTITLYPVDYGGSIRLLATARVASVVVAEERLTIPIDTDGPNVDPPPDTIPDGDGLPDAWESLFGALTPNGDIDTSLPSGNPNIGDGLTNFEEYRGFVWVEDMVPDFDPDYKTDAFVPDVSPIDHFRSDPNIKDLFVRYTGYGGAFPQFAMGTAFLNSGPIAVHALNSATPVTTTHGEAYIDVLLVTNQLVSTYGGKDGHINPETGVREYSWDTKGSSNIGTFSAYGLNTSTYQTSLTFYFDDNTYQDISFIGGVTPHNGVLDLLASVDDQNDDGALTLTLTGPPPKDKDINSNTIVDGDRLIPGSFTSDLSVFDIDNDGLVELPEEDDPAVADKFSEIANEYTMKQVLKHTVTHEMGHAVGINHGTVSSSLMYLYSPDWARDHLFSDISKSSIKIHSDFDGDVLGSHMDNCPADFNPSQANADGDFMGDICDPFPLDFDNDGIPDLTDPCPTDPFNLPGCSP